jgi:cytochrome bd ubiquinol oxidase subunit II
MAIESWIGLVLLVNLSIYLNLGGADFGARYLDLVTSGPLSAKQRTAFARVIGPGYAVNHVLFLMVAGLLFVAWPLAVEVAMGPLSVPVTVLVASLGVRCTSLLLLGRVGERALRTGPWRVVQGTASVLAPLSLGMVLAAMGSGELRVDVAARVVRAGPVSAWLSPFGLVFGGFLLSLGCLMASTRVLAATEEEGVVTELLRRRALRCAVATGALAFATFLLSGQGAPYLHDGLSGRWWSLPFQLITAAVAVSAIFALWQGRDSLAVILVTAQVTLVMLGWGLSMQPYLIYPDVTLARAAGSPRVLRFVLGALVVGTVLLLVSFVYPRSRARRSTEAAAMERED